MQAHFSSPHSSRRLRQLTVAAPLPLPGPQYATQKQQVSLLTGYAHMAHKATKWHSMKVLTGLQCALATKQLVKYTLFYFITTATGIP